MVLLRGQHVNGFIVHGCEGAVPVHFGNHTMIARIGGIDHHDILGVDRPEADLVSRVALRCPVPTVVSTVQYALFFQVLQKLFQVFPAEFFSLFKGQLKSRTFDVMQQDEQIVRIDAAMLRREREKVIRIFHDKLVQRIAACDQDGKRSACAPARASGLLPGAGNRSRIARHDAGFQIADVNAQFQRVGADDTHYFTCAQAVFDFPPEVRQITAAVSGDKMVVKGFGFYKLVFQIFGQHFDIQAAGCKNYCLNVIVD